ncbi:IucA/IucC family protein [Pseudalkalibacillus sp. SCS-8]|uniref:IucA/IucC family protein n=1 Tax=Pseudalkalibacillus nanhaiensis TaxID=3115291 RepID=UPI0032DA519C
MEAATINANNNVTDYKSQVIAHLKQAYPHLVNSYEEKLKEADSAILHQLVQAILRERIVDFEWITRNECQIALIKLDTHETVEVPIRTTYILDHIDLDGEILHTDSRGGVTVISRPAQLLDRLFEAFHADSFDNIDQFYKEIENSMYNYALALTIAEERQMKIKADAISLQSEGTFDYLVKKKKHDASFSPLTFLEQWVIQGHSIHPCSRTRLGLSPASISEYAPEWEGRPSVIPVAVHKDYCKLTHFEDRSVSNLLKQEYPELAVRLNETLTARNLNPHDYEIIPVHPWQLEHTIQQNYRDELESQKVVPITEASIDTAALISFRSLAPVGDQNKHHIKTAINVQMTSAIRTVSAASTQNGPKVSSVLEKIHSEDAFLANSMSFMKESAGIHFEPVNPEDDEERHFLQKNLAAIMRENPEKSLADDEIALPAAAFIAKSPVTDQLLIEELVKNHAIKGGFDTLTDAAADFIEKYVSVLLPGVLTLMSKYGVSMEVHMQNCVCVFKNGSPEKIVVRDNGGIRIMESRLNEFFKIPELNNSTNLMTSNRQDLLDIFFHAIVHNHLGEMIVALSRKLGMDEEQLWRPVRHVVEQVYASLQHDARVPAENLTDKDDLFSEESRLKALVRMRLTNKYTENAYVNVTNPLYPKKEECAK